MFNIFVILLDKIAELQFCDPMYEPRNTRVNPVTIALSINLNVILNQIKIRERSFFPEIHYTFRGRKKLSL